LSEPVEPAAHEAEHSGKPVQEAESEAEKDESKDSPSANARITDRSDNYQFAHRSTGRRARRGRGGPPPVKPEEHRSTNGHSPRAMPMISELLREGQEILVQVSKEPLGKKGARITSHIALPGRYLVYMPTVDHVGVSRKIASDEERLRLKRIINEHRNGLPGGFIVRTAAEGRGEDEFIQDIRFLGNLWSDIRSKSEKKAAPTLIHRDLNLVQRLLRDQLSQDYRAIRLDNETEFATVLDFVSKFQPALVNRVKLHTKDTPIFEEYGLNTEIEKALRPKVWLKSGGYIVINQTEALVAIDVNTGKFVGKSNRLEDTIVRTNVDAVHEIVRQIRLRNLGGIIVVDFIDMEEKKNRQRVMAALEEAVRADRVPSKILQFNDFGLVAITRKRTQPSLERTLCRPCSYCNGSGWSKSPETICYDIQQEIKKMAHLFDAKEITVRVNPEIAKALKSGEFVSLSEIEEWTKKDITVKSDPLLHEEHFDIN
jgi:ribonuclease G